MWKSSLSSPFFIAGFQSCKVNQDFLKGIALWFERHSFANVAVAKVKQLLKQFSNAF